MRLEHFNAETLTPNLQAAFMGMVVRLYPLAERTQDDAEVEAILTDAHTLSHYYRWEGFVAYRNQTPVGRGIVFAYPEDDTAYFGFVEASDIVVMKYLMADAEETARKFGKTALCGPLDGSFWLRYRWRKPSILRLPFTGEPWQQAWYPDCMEELGFSVWEKYESNYHGAKLLALNKVPEKMQARLDRAEKLGYEFVHPTNASWDSQIEDVYKLIIHLYADFPTFKSISLAEFRTLFGKMQKIIDYKMVDLAYLGKQLCGFLITLPDYGNLVYRKMTPWNILRILHIRKHPQHYCMLYMGVRPDHAGLGQALLCRQVKTIIKRKATCTSALIRQGKVTSRYAADYVNNTTYYYLYRKELLPADPQSAQEAEAEDGRNQE